MRRRACSFGASLALVLLLAGSVAAPVRFETPASWSTSGNMDVSDVALGDVDGDGDLDLAAFSDTVQLYRNGPGGLESSPAWTSTETTGGGLGSVVWADLDRDGYPDLVTSLGVYDNTNGVLAAAASWTNLTGSLAFAVGDVDGNTFPDLLLGLSSDVLLYLNVGGTIDDFEDWTGTYSTPGALALADFDGDTYPEVVVGGYFFSNEPIQMFDNVGGVLQGPASWTSVETGGVNHLSAGDVDGDGYPELLALTTNFPEEFPNRMYRNTAGALSTTATWESARPTDGQDAAFADLDDDGDLDLAIANSPMLSFATFDFVNGTELVYTNEGGVIDPVHDWESDLQDSSYGLAVGDVDGDGAPDLVVANREDLFQENPGRALVYRNRGPNQAPTISAMIALPAQPRGNDLVTVTVTATDADGDSLSYAFNASGGTIVSQTAGVLVWRAPPTAGAYSVTVIVTDGSGGEATRSLNLDVSAPQSSSPANLLLVLTLVVVIAGIAGGAVFVARRRKKPSPAGPAPAAPGPAAPLSAIPDDRVAGLRSAYQRGMLPRNLYGENLAKLLGAPPSMRRDNLLRAFAEGRIDEGMLEQNLRRLAAEPT